MHLSKAKGWYIEANVQGGGVQKLDSVHGQWDHVTALVSGWPSSWMKHWRTTIKQWVAILRGQWGQCERWWYTEIWQHTFAQWQRDELSSCPELESGQNLKVGKMNHGLGKQAPDRTMYSKCGPNFPKSGKKFIHVRAAIFAAFSILIFGIFWILLPVIVHRKWGNKQRYRQDLFFYRLRMYTAQYKQLVPNNSQSINSIMSLAGPSHCRCIFLISKKHMVAVLRPMWKVVCRNLTACMGNGTTWLHLYLADLEWSTGALQ